MHDDHPLAGDDLVVEGLRLHVVRRGPAVDGPAVLLLHGVPTSSYLWHDVTRDLARNRTVLAPDLLGLGRSERPGRRRLRLDAQARVLAALLDVADLDRVVVVGHDLGGSVAVHLAALAPDRVLGLVLVGAPVHTQMWPVAPVLPLLLPGGRAYAEGLRRVPPLARAVLARALGGTRAPTAAALEHYLAPLLAPGGAASLVRLLRAVDLDAVEASWRLLQTAPPPALVLWGEDDHLHSTAYGRRVATEIGGDWVPVAGAGHLLPQQRPERVAEEIEGFLADLAPILRHPPPGRSVDG